MAWLHSSVIESLIQSTVLRSELSSLGSHLLKLAGTGHPLLSLLEERMPFLLQLQGQQQPGKFLKSRGSNSSGGDPTALNNESSTTATPQFLSKARETAVKFQLRGIASILISRAAAHDLGSSSSSLSSKDEEFKQIKLNQQLPSDTAADREGDAVLSKSETLAPIAEMIHLASVIHDHVLDTTGVPYSDVVEKAALGNKIAVLSGDYLLAQSCVTLASLRDPFVVQLMSRSIADLIEARFLLSHLPQSGALTVEYALDALRKKSGSLLGHSCQSSVLLLKSPVSTHSSQLVASSRQFGESIGLCLELVEDIQSFSSADFSQLIAPHLPNAPGYTLRKRSALPTAIAMLVPSTSNVGQKRLSEIIQNTGMLTLTDVKEFQKIIQDSGALQLTIQTLQENALNAERQLSFFEDSFWKEQLLCLTKHIKELPSF